MLSDRASSESANVSKKRRVRLCFRLDPIKRPGLKKADGFKEPQEATDQRRSINIVLRIFWGERYQTLAR
jgi:hypothetical protein